MDKFITAITEFNNYSVVFRVLLAVLLGGLIGFERGFHGRAAGLRTHILVCIGSCLASLTGLYVANEGGTSDVFRLAAQVVSGLGFLGAGTIIVRKANVTGLTTAAGLWATGAIGIAVGFGFYLGAVLSTVSCLVTVMLFTKFESNRKYIFRLYIEIDDSRSVNDIIDAINTDYSGRVVDFNVVPSKSQIDGSIGMEVSFYKRSGDDAENVIKELLVNNHITFVVGQ